MIVSPIRSERTERLGDVAARITGRLAVSFSRSNAIHRENEIPSAYLHRPVPRSRKWDSRTVTEAAHG